MNGAFYIGATGLQAGERALDAIANNVTNINTTAFKRSEVSFSDILVSGRQPLPLLRASQGVGDFSVAAGVRAAVGGPVMEQGQIRPTGRPLDIAIDGSGFVELLAPDGHALLWRGGTLKVNADGFLATPDGSPLKSMISVPENASGISIASDGTVAADFSDGAPPRQIGRIELIAVNDPSQLRPLGGSKYELDPSTRLDVLETESESAGNIVQGALEASNVDLATEMVTLLLLQRSYAASAQVVQAGDQLMSIANGLKR